MKRHDLYAHGADPSVYPTVAAMIDAYVRGYYRTYPHEAWMRIGPPPEVEGGAGGYALIAADESRPRAHAVIVLPRRIVLIHCARARRLAEMRAVMNTRGGWPRTGGTDGQAG